MSAWRRRTLRVSAERTVRDKINRAAGQVLPPGINQIHFKIQMKPMRFSMIAVMGLLASAAGAQLQAADAADTARGKAAFERVCTKCHGVPTEGAEGPALVPMYLTRDAVLAVVRGGQAKMPPILKTTVSDEEIAAIVEYLNSLGQ